MTSRNASVQEWAIQDVATGEWWVVNYSEFLGGYWSANSDNATIFSNYRRAANEFRRGDDYRNDNARIVLAPPREMTDEECWEWFKTQDMLVLSGTPVQHPSEHWGVFNSLTRPQFMTVGIGRTPCDAIRAARRKLEGDK